MSLLRLLIVFVTIFCSTFNTFFVKFAYSIDVAVSIKPVHSLVSMVSEGVFTPILIVKGNTSPHDIQLSAKTIREIQNTEMIFIVSKELEIPIYKAVQNHNKLYQMVDFKGLTLLNFTDEKIIFTGDINKNKELSGLDFHIWLDPINAIVIIKEVTKIFSAKDPINANKYKNNCIKYTKKLENLNLTLRKNLKPYKNSSFILYHNGFAYLENRYNLSCKGIIQTGCHAVSHFLSNNYSNKKLIELGNYIKNNNVKCVFLEPEFNNRVLLRYLEENNIEHTMIDPVGYNLIPGPDLYFNLLIKDCESFKKCFNR